VNLNKKYIQGAILLTEKEHVQKTYSGGQKPA
jgi:hypothetical protein